MFRRFAKSQSAGELYSHIFPFSLRSLALSLFLSLSLYVQQKVFLEGPQTVGLLLGDAGVPVLSDACSTVPHAFLLLGI